MTILTLANSKGSGGKTTIAACLAAELTRRGKEVVLLDADPQRSLTVWHGNDGKLKELELHTDATEKAAKWASEASKRAIVVAGYRWLCFDHSSRRPEDLGRSTDPLSCKRP